MKRALPTVVLAAVLTIPISFQAAADPEPRHRPVDREAKHMLVRPAATLSEFDRRDLAAMGIRLQQPLSGGRWIALVTAPAMLTADERIDSIEPLVTDEKIHPGAARELASGRAWAELNVIFHDDVAFDDAREAVLASGAALTDPLATTFLPMQRLEVRLAPASAGALAADDRVFALAGPRRMKVREDNATTAIVSHVSDVQAAPYGLSGLGVTVSLFELGQSQSSHPEFGGRATVIPDGCGGTNNQHATHVMGTIGAAGLRADAKGMAPNANIFQFCVDTTANRWLTAKDGLSSRGVVADNNSWGFILGWNENDSSAPGQVVWNGYDAYYGAYDLLSGAPIDKISINRNVLFLHSAGNDGDLPSFSGDVYKPHLHVDDNGDVVKNVKWCISANGSGNDCPTTTCTGGCEKTMHAAATPFDTMGVTASAKNVIAVGNVSGTTPSNVTISGSSSRGPAKDGRVKPDVVARGSNVTSTVPVNTYGKLSGTSMSTPAVTGIAALLTEQWRRTFLADPKAWELKALILAGADDIGNPGPDYTYGFGLVNAQASADLIIADAGQGNRIRDLSISNGQTQELAATVTAQQNLRVLLSWPDPALAYLGGDDIAAKALLNDLDVKVITPQGQTVLPYVLDKANVTANATRGTNTVDNAEVVEIANAGAGTYRIVVSGTDVQEGPQNAVLVANARLAKACTDITEGAGNNSAETAYGNLPTKQTVYAGLCSQGDLDFYKFLVTKKGSVAVEVKTGDTGVRVSLSGAGLGAASVEVPANSTRTISTTANTIPSLVSMKVEVSGAMGAEPQYSFTPIFGEVHGAKRRGIRH